MNPFIRLVSVFAFLFILIFSGCSTEPEKPFKLLSSAETGITFSNDVENTPEFNILNYLYFYDGGGVAAGDINNDGLPDLFFTGNSVQNQLYLNKGNFEFENVTESAGITDDENAWSTGVTMVDVNGDGYLDIYVSRSNYLEKTGRNQLFINNGDSTFTERAKEFGIDFEGFTTQAAFFDYNNNGRLDLFLVNHSFHGDNSYGPVDQLRSLKDPKAGDRLFRNDGNSFTDVTEEAGFFSSSLGYGLGIAINDINMDGYADIYIGNDFHEDDYFYINNGNGTFTEALYDMVGHTSSSSMGNDIADINNDGLPDILSMDMLGVDHETFLRSGGPDPVIVANTKKNYGYGEKNSKNTLHVNQGFLANGLPIFSETAFASGVAKTDWSWAGLIADFNNDGRNDIYITNGMPHRPNDLDFINRLRRARQQFSGAELDAEEYNLIETMPSVHLSNFMFRNGGNAEFTDVSEEWGLFRPSYSTGAVYVDLNNNGRLDLVVNNINEEAFIYQNKEPEEGEFNYLMLSMKGGQENSTGIGTKVLAYVDEKVFFREQLPVRGFQSAVDHRIHIGLGDYNTIDSLVVVWPDRQVEVLENVDVNQILEIDQSNATAEFDYLSFKKSVDKGFFRNITDRIELDYRHNENSFDNFNREPLMPYALSTRGPALAVADVNGDGLDDFYAGGARGQSGAIFIQRPDGSFEKTNLSLFENDKEAEDVDALFFDATGDGLPDLYVASGGHEKSDDSADLEDRLYINRGEERFEKSSYSLPDMRVNGSVVAAADFDGDGAQDLFVGGHSVSWRYGIGPQSYLLKNNGRGLFEDVTVEWAQDIETIGNVTSAVWVQNPETEYPNLMIAGEWMPLSYFENNGEQFIQKTEELGFSDLKGLWQSLQVGDITGNGYPDIIAGNFGLNSRLKASTLSPLTLLVNDFDEDGQSDPIITYQLDGKTVPFEPFDELLGQMSDMTDRVRSYQDYSSKSVEELFGTEQVEEALRKPITELRSFALLNDESGGFDIIPLPAEAQWFPVITSGIWDVDHNGKSDIMLAGNIFDVKPSIGGRQDAGYGLLMNLDDNDEFQTIPMYESGFSVPGESRNMGIIKTGNGQFIYIVVRNNDSPLFFEVKQRE